MSSVRGLRADGSEIIFYRLVQRDMNGIQRFHSAEASPEASDRFYEQFLEMVERALNAPAMFHPVYGTIRRANIKGFPYHFLYREIQTGIRVLVLRHDKRHASFELSRK